MKNETMEESKIIKGFSTLKSKLTKENIKKFSSKYRVPFDYKIIALVATIISACSMLFVNAFEFNHSYADWFVKSYYQSFGEILHGSSNNYPIYTLFQYNLDSVELGTLLKVLTVVMLLLAVVFLILNRTKVSLASSAGMVFVMILTLFRSTNYEAAVGSMSISVLGWYYVIWLVVVLGFLANLFACIKTKKIIDAVIEDGTTEAASTVEVAATEKDVVSEDVLDEVETIENVAIEA